MGKSQEPQSLIIAKGQVCKTKNEEVGKKSVLLALQLAVFVSGMIR